MIDLMSNITMTNNQINTRVVSLIRQKYTESGETKLTRIAVGALQKSYVPTAIELKSIADYQVHVLAMRNIGKQAKLDSELLSNVLDYEKAVVRLAAPALDPLAKDKDGVLVYPKVAVFDPKTGKTTNKTNTNPLLVIDTSERKVSTALIKAASKATIGLATKRIPKAIV